MPRTILDAAKAEVERVRKYGITATMIADKLGTSRTVLSFWLTATREAPAGKLEAVIDLARQFEKAYASVRLKS